MPATYRLLVCEARHGLSPVRRVVVSPCRWKATRNWLPSGHAGKLNSATRGCAVCKATGFSPETRGMIRNGTSASLVCLVFVLRTVTFTRASCSYSSGRQANSDRLLKSRKIWTAGAAQETAMAATKQAINGILLRIAAKYGTDFALWSDCAGFHRVDRQ